MSATAIPGFSSSASSAFDGASSSSRSGRSSQPAPATPMTGAKTRPLTGCRRCASTSTPATMTMATLTAITRICLLSLNDLKTLVARPASPDDADRIAQIYNEGIEDRVGTFETRLRAPEDVRAWFDGVHPIVVVENGGAIVAFASTSTYRARACYAGIAEFSVYVARAARGRGAGTIAMRALIDAACHAG